MTTTMRDAQLDDVLSSAGDSAAYTRRATARASREAGNRRADVPAVAYALITPTVARETLRTRCSAERPQGLLRRATRLVRGTMIASAAVGYGWMWVLFFLG